MIIVFLAFLLTFPILNPHITVAQPNRTPPAVCEYQEKRKPIPTNPKTNNPYAPDERNQEPFDGGSISKDEIRQCLQAKTPIKNHHIMFDDYWQAWASLAKETGDYAIPILIKGGVLHAPAYNEEANTGGIRLWKFRDPKVSNGWNLTEEERKAFRIEQKDVRIALIRSQIHWNKVFIDSAVIPFSEGRQNTGAILPIVFSAEANFGASTFSAEANFGASTFSTEANFKGSTFSSKAYFNDSTFSSKANFGASTFSAEANFGASTFSAEARFSASTFSAEANFMYSTFSAEANFVYSTFSAEANFMYSTFSAEANFMYSTFSAEANFSASTFSAEANFVYSTFSAEANFMYSTFSAEANFSASTFSAEARFFGTRFKNNADFRDIIVFSDQLLFNNTTWEKRIDLRGISVKDLRWDSTHNPSYVKGVVDLRDARIGSATVKEVRFQDLVDFSRITVGQYEELIYGPPTKAQWKKQSSYGFKQSNKVYAWVNQSHSRPLMHFENNTFENEADFLHIKLHGPVIFINNRFRSTLDLTGTTFEPKKASFCLSYNRINRLVFEPEHLGTPPGIDPYNHFKNLRGNPLEISQVRMIQASKSSGDRECSVITPTDSNSTNTTTQGEEPLDGIYKTLGKAFREANGLTGINEAWYLETVARRAHKVNDWDWVERLFLDIPSRHSVDVWRSIWISVFIMAVFYVLYLVEFVVFEGGRRLGKWLGRPGQEPRKIHPLKHDKSHRAFRMRLFEPIHSTTAVGSRTYAPWRDAATLSARSFLKIGLGTVYPNTRLLKCLTMAEWLIGAYMLVHFVLALKNNLPSIAPFLGVVN
jgi:hypothetical protein